jgi:ankyrin repeat protein
MIAAEKGHLTVMEKLLELGANIHASNRLGLRDM